MDFTRFDVRIGGESQPSMWKRNAIFHIWRHLCRNGIDPEEISDLINGVCYWVDGSVTESEFEILATEKASAGGAAFKSSRWYCGEGELVHANQKAYAFSNQWGGQDWHNAMDRLKEKYDEFHIDYSPAT